MTTKRFLRIDIVAYLLLIVHSGGSLRSIPPLTLHFGNLLKRRSSAGRKILPSHLISRKKKINGRVCKTKLSGKPQLFIQTNQEILTTSHNSNHYADSRHPLIRPPYFLSPLLFCGIPLLLLRCCGPASVTTNITTHTDRHTNCNNSQPRVSPRGSMLFSPHSV